MKNIYEAMFIFQKDLDDDALEQILGDVRGAIETAGGDVKSMTRLGRRSFAREMKKQDSGHYTVLGFEMEGARVAAFKDSFKRNDKVLRVQIVRAKQSAEENLTETKKEGS